MIVCKHCSTKNELESKFCKSCGLELSDEDRDRARAEVDKLVADGYALLGQSRTEEAALVAEKVLEGAPDFAEALSLLGMCHERNHDVLAALSCYERVVELRPDSALDKIKVQQLRNTLTREVQETKKPNRALAFAGAAAAVILVGSIGGIVATFVARPASASVVQTEQPQNTETAGAPFSSRELNVPKTKEQAPPSGGTGPTTTVPPVTNDGGVPDGGSRIRIPSGPGPGVLPDASRQGGTTQIGGIDPGTQPFKPPVPEEGVTTVPTGGVKPPTGDDPQPDQGPGGTQKVEPEDPMKGIEIKVHKSSPIGNSGSQDASHTEGGLTTLLKAAREQFMLGKWASAASMYERALRAGGDPGSVNQRLGQCYSKMGKNSEAIAAYSRAESALQSAVNGGRSSSKSALEAVRQALQNLRG